MGISSIINVAILLAAAGVQQPGFGVPLILGATTHFTDRIRFYSGTDGMVSDGFLTTDPEYLAAQKMLAQSPQVQKFAVGRCANKPTMHWTITPTAVNLTLYQVLVGAQTASYTSDGTATVDEINQGLMTAINALTSPGVTAALVGAPGSSTAFTLTATAAGSWVEVQITNPALLTLLQDNVDPGVAADLDAIKAVDNTWYGLVSVFSSKAEVLAIAAWAEANLKIYAQGVQDGDCLGAGTSDVMATAKTSTYARTSLWYHPDNGAFIGAALLGKLLPKDPGSATWGFKTLNSVAGVALTDTQITNLRNKYGNFYTSLGGVNCTFDGKVSANEWVDIIIGRDWLISRIQTRCVNKLLALDKVAYTDEGIAIMEAEVRAALREGVDGDVLAGNPVPVVTAPLAANVSNTDKSNRVLNNLSFTATLAGAIQAANINGTVSF